MTLRKQGAATDRAPVSWSTASPLPLCFVAPYVRCLRFSWPSRCCLKFSVRSVSLRRVTTTEAIRLLEKFRAGGVSRDQVLRAFQAAPSADLGFAQVDTHRALRKGFPEVVFGAGKTPAQV